MKKTDFKIIAQLRQNGRLPLTQLSRKVGLPVSTLHDRIKQHIKKGVLKPSTLINFQKVGYNAKAQVLLTVEAGEKAKLVSYLKEIPNVNSLFRINNGWSIIMECVFEDMYLLEDFIETIEGKFKIKKKEVCYVLDEIKREQFMGNI